MQCWLWTYDGKLPHIFVPSAVLNPEHQGDINKIINGTLQKMKEALTHCLRENIKNIYYFDLMDLVYY